MAEREQCDACRGEGSVMVSGWCDQYGRTHASYDTCPGCGGEGEIELEPLDQDDLNASATFANPGDDCPEAIAQWVRP